MGEAPTDRADDPSIILVETIEKLSAARTVEAVAEIVRSAARQISGADGVCFVLRDEGECHYLDEDAIGPLWKGRRFPMTSCISGWAMMNRQTAVIPDIYLDDRIPHDAYRPTFVKSLVMTPVRPDDPIAAIGAYWAQVREPTAQETSRLSMIARATATALENVRLIASLEDLVKSRDFLIRELNHRVKNSLATVGAIAQQTLRAAPSPDAFIEALQGRLKALSRGQDLLAREASGSPRLRDVLEAALVPAMENSADRWSLEGPDVRLSAETATNFLLGFHELGTNAVRHGALSDGAGRVDVHWRIDEFAQPPQLSLAWVEQGGPVVSPPSHKGFGMRLAQGGMGPSVGGTAEMTFEPRGLRFELRAPFSKAIVRP